VRTRKSSDLGEETKALELVSWSAGNVQLQQNAMNQEYTGARFEFCENSKER
jgi:hypothetical protein